MQAVGRTYADGSCRIIAWGLAPDLTVTPSLDVGDAALVVVDELRRTGEAGMMLFDDTGAFLGSDIGALPDPTAAPHDG